MGETIIFAGDTIRESGIYRDTTESYASCDSIRTIDVYINNMSMEVDFDGRLIRALEQEADSFKWYNCNNDSVEIDNDKEYYLPLETGKYKVIIAKGECEFTSDCYEVCFPNKYRLDTLKCENDPITINDVEYTKRGFYVQELKQVGFDCDSTLEIDIKDVAFDKRVRESNDTLISFETGAKYQCYNCGGDVLIADAIGRDYTLTQDGGYKFKVTKQRCIVFIQSTAFT